jgi:hypothetical protein
MFSYVKSDTCTNCIQTNECDIDTRQQFINDCVPIYDMVNSGVNILNFSKTNYIYFNVDNLLTYYIDNNFYLQEYGKKMANTQLSIII